MDKESDVIKHQLEHTRAALTDKLELLEHQVSDTVTGAVETVEKVRQTVQETVSGAAETVATVQHCIQDTVASVQESVRETAEAVSETLDIRKQVDKHPWAMMAGATAFGFGLGILIDRVNAPIAASAAAPSVTSSTTSLRAGGNGSIGMPGGSGPPPSFLQRREQNGRDHRSLISQDQRPWLPAMNQLKGLAIGAMFGVLRDVLSNSMPDTVSGPMGKVIDNFTTSLGGQPIAGRIVPKPRESQIDAPSQGRAWQENSPRPRQTAMANIEK